MSWCKFVAVFLVLLAAGCATQTHVLTPLEMQSLQTREYEATKDIVFPSVLSVFQDLGYIFRVADKETGVITAEGANQRDAGLVYIITDQTIATAFVEQIGTITKVRINIVTKQSVSSGFGKNSEHDTPVLDEKIYQNVFKKIENAIFIRSGN